tara:strand:- start:373 stop:1437 length:1065 start_codon:yes stop_codon:yes gene_type:complete
MVKYYTRACNFYYGNHAKLLIKKKIALPLCGKNNLAFDCIEFFARKNRRVKSKKIFLKNLKKLSNFEYKLIKKDLVKISSKRKNFLKNVNFSKPTLMGILNLTPDSFSDGGKYNSNKKSFNHISKMIREGAQIIDVGGESTRPGSKTIESQAEWKRVKYVIQNFKKKFKRISLSLDTRKHYLMLKGIKHGVDLINDVSGFKFDPLALQKISNYKIPKVLHHMKGNPNTMQKNPKYENVLLDIYDFFEDSINKKFKDKKIILDPGIGFGKTLKHNLTLISKISLFHTLGYPILIGTSRKRFINQISGTNDSKERIGGTLASVLYLLSQGVQVFRVHNVNEVKQGILVFDKIIFNQ